METKIDLYESDFESAWLQYVPRVRRWYYVISGHGSKGGRPGSRNTVEQVSLERAYAVALEFGRLDELDETVEAITQTEGEQA
jgi:hypothetical protein